MDEKISWKGKEASGAQMSLIATEIVAIGEWDEQWNYVLSLMLILYPLFFQLYQDGHREIYLF